MACSDQETTNGGYRHHGVDGEHLPLPVGKVVCIGKNYAAHAREMGSEPPDEPILFIKPTTAIVAMHNQIVIDPDLGEHHYEVEMTVLIGRQLSRATPEQARQAIYGVGVGLDLTLRVLQRHLKERGWPWEKCKAFDGSCVLSGFVPAARVPDLQDVTLRLALNGKVRQESNSGLMLYPVLELLVHISEFFTLMPGDVVMTGTPEGVGSVVPGDQLAAELAGLIRETSSVVARTPGLP